MAAVRSSRRKGPEYYPAGIAIQVDGKVTGVMLDTSDTVWAATVRATGVDPDRLFDGAHGRCTWEGHGLYEGLPSVPYGTGHREEVMDHNTWMYRHTQRHENIMAWLDAEWERRESRA